MGVNVDGSYTEVTHTGYGTRIGKSLAGIGGGFAMLAAATGLLWWNEGRSVRTADAIMEAQRIAVEMPSPANVDPAFDGKVVHVQGHADTTDTLADPVFGVSVQALKLSRKVEYYQWVESSKSETKKKVGGGEETVTTYTYDRRWVDSPVDSSRFKNPQGHENWVVAQGLEDQRWQAQNVSFGAYRLPDFVVAGIGGARDFDPQLPEEQVRALNQRMFPGSVAGAPTVAGAMGQVVTSAVSGQPALWPQPNGFYLGRSTAMPETGDIRVTFRMTPPADISLIAQVTGDTFKKYTASNGATFHALAMGQESMPAMFEGAKRSNIMLTWFLRGAGLLLAIGGLKLILAPLAVLADVLPWLGSLVGLGTGLIASCLGGAWSCLVIAVAWIRFRPVLGCCLLAVTVGLTVAVFFLRAKKKAAAAAVAPTPQPAA